MFKGNTEFDFILMYAAENKLNILVLLSWGKCNIKLTQTCYKKKMKNDGVNIRRCFSY